MAGIETCSSRFGYFDLFLNFNHNIKVSWITINVTFCTKRDLQRETNKNQLLENMNCMFYINLKAEWRRFPLKGKIITKTDVEEFMHPMKCSIPVLHSRRKSENVSEMRGWMCRRRWAQHSFLFLRLKPFSKHEAWRKFRSFVWIIAKKTGNMNCTSP